MLRRYAIALPLGAVVVLGALLGMERLIHTAQRHLQRVDERQFVDFVRVERQETTQRRQRRRERPPVPPIPPPAPQTPRIDTAQPGDLPVAIDLPTLETPLAVGGFSEGPGDGEYLPIVKIAPQYPLSARSRQIEGHVLVEYTVTTTGAVRDVIVLEAEPPHIFDRVCIEAALKFKYKPRVVDGAAIEVPGVRNIFYFRLDQE